MNKKYKIVHIINGLNIGGAETMLYKLLKHIDKSKYDINVISMMDEGFYGTKIRSLGINVYSLNMRRGIPSISAILKARKYIKDADIVQTWLYHADLLGYIITRFSKYKKLIWGIRHSNLDKDKNKSSTLKIVKMNSFFSKKVDYIVSNSIKAKETHHKIGYAVEKFKIIPNGFDLSSFYKIEGAKEKLNELIENSNNLPVLTNVGRWDKQKDYPNLLKALSILKNKEVRFKAVLCGTNIDYDNTELLNLIYLYDLEEEIKLLGRRSDIPMIMSGSDLYVLSSIGEGFPNVVGEAMACETPCVVTDVGDARMIVGETGVVVAPRNSNELANGILQILQLNKDGRERLGNLARERVVKNFSIDKIVKQFEELYIK